MEQHCPGMHSGHRERAPASAHRAGCTALLRYALTFTAKGLAGLGNPGLAEGKSWCTISLAKPPLCCEVAVPTSAPMVGIVLGGSEDGERAQGKGCVLREQPAHTSCSFFCQ